jgi:hypothetical protein
MAAAVPAHLPGGRVAFIEGFASDRAVVTGTANVLGSGPLAPELDVTWLAFADEDTLWCAGARRSGTFAARLGVDGGVDELFAADALIGLRFQPKVLYERRRITHRRHLRERVRAA